MSFAVPVYLLLVEMFLDPLLPVLVPGLENVRGLFCVQMLQAYTRNGKNTIIECCLKLQQREKAKLGNLESIVDLVGTFQVLPRVSCSNQHPVHIILRLAIRHECNEMSLSFVQHQKRL